VGLVTVNHSALISFGRVSHDVTLPLQTTDCRNAQPLYSERETCF
jgi:hypothetical protein